MQPPSGGCVLKLTLNLREKRKSIAAAFGRLCVETTLRFNPFANLTAAAFGRLCVETLQSTLPYPVSFRSRLRAAVC